MKKLLLFIFVFSLAANLPAKEIEVVIEDWKDGLKGWTTSLAKKESPPGTMTFNRGKGVDVLVPSELVFIKKSNIPMLGITKLKVTVTPLDLEWSWLEIGIIIQSSAEEWETLKLQHIKKEQKEQTFEFEIDGDMHSDSEWNHMWIRLTTHKPVRVRVHKITATKVVDDE